MKINCALLLTHGKYWSQIHPKWSMFRIHLYSLRNHRLVLKKMLWQSLGRQPPWKKNGLGKLQIQWGNPHLCSSRVTREEQCLRPSLTQMTVENSEEWGTRAFLPEKGITAPHGRFTHPSGLRTISRSDHPDFRMCVALCFHFPLQKICACTCLCVQCGSEILYLLTHKFHTFRIKWFVFYAFLSWLRSCEKCAIVELSDLVPLIAITYHVPWIRRKSLLF